MKRTELEPTEQTFLCLLHACASTGRYDRIYAIVRDMAEVGLGLNKFYYAGMITAHLNQTPRTDDISSKIIDIVEQSKRCSRVCPRTITENFMMNVCEEELYNLPTTDYVNSRTFFLDRNFTVYHVAFNALGELRDVQAVVYGRDPNWGRTACAAGYAEISFDQNKLRISLGDILLMDKGQPLPFDAAAASNYPRMAGEKHGTVLIQLSIGDGPGNGKAWGCGMSYDYVKINAEYTT